jgi:hypothetical protein
VRERPMRKSFFVRDMRRNYTPIRTGAIVQPDVSPVLHEEIK